MVISLKLAQISSEPADSMTYSQIPQGLPASYEAVLATSNSVPPFRSLLPFFCSYRLIMVRIKYKYF